MMITLFDPEHPRTDARDLSLRAAQTHELQEALRAAVQRRRAERKTTQGLSVRDAGHVNRLRRLRRARPQAG
jgi:molybdenum cofactor biosynthesis enzyme MoaA